MEEARSELHKIINDREMKDALLLVFANKQDIQGHLNPEEVINALQLTQLKDKLWYVAPSVATDGTGIFEGLVSSCLSLIGCSILTAPGLALQQRQDSPAEIISSTALRWCPVYNSAHVRSYDPTQHLPFFRRFHFLPSMISLRSYAASI